jgi:hypothetical protein
MMNAPELCSGGVKDATAILLCHGVAPRLEGDGGVMTQERPTRGFRERWSTLALVVAVMTAGTAWQSTAADPLTPPPTTGTATGTYRTGLAKAGLVSVESLGDAHLCFARNSLDGDDAAVRPWVH